MKRFMNWLTNSFTPTMNKFSQKPVVAALSSSMQKIIPFILTGSCIHLYNVLRSTIPALPNFIRIINFSFGMLGLLTAFMVANQMMEKLGHTQYTINAGLTAISVFIMFIKPVIDANGMFSVEFNRFGPTGIIVGIVALPLAIAFGIASGVSPEKGIITAIVRLMNNWVFVRSVLALSKRFSSNF